MSTAKIIYTITDEAPALATYSLLPIVQGFTRAAGVAVETRDISLAGRILAAFPEHLTPGQRQSDDLAELGELAKTPEANIIKLPNISASVPQLKAAIKELQQQGYAVPDYPEDPQNDAEKAIKARYAKVLRERRQPGAAGRQLRPSRGHVGEGVRQGAPALDGQVVAGLEIARLVDERRRLLRQRAGRGRSASVGKLAIEFTDAATGGTSVLKEVSVDAGDVIAASMMSRAALQDFFAAQIADAKARGVLLSLHLKATMMKVSDPIMFGHAVIAYYKDVFDKHAAVFERLGVDPDNGIGDVYAKIQALPADQKAAIEADIQAVYATRPPLAMVDSSKGITNLHVPSDVIIDASMPAAIRASGQMWGPDGKLHDMKAMIPDRCYAGIYQATIDDCRAHGAFDVTTMGTVSNVGLMAQAAEEYGSHDKTFEIAAAGTMRVTDRSGQALVEHRVAPGDIWRMCRTRDLPIRDWVKLAVNRARATGHAAIFWLDDAPRLRPPRHRQDAAIPRGARHHRPRHPRPAPRSRPSRPRSSACAGARTPSPLTGNVLRDYLTDLFPILELGTSAKMLSIVPLLAGGGLYETGAGGSAPKHVQQLLQENYLRWDSLGEFLALAVSIEDLGLKTGNQRAVVVAEALDRANGQILEHDKSPQRKVGEIDNRGSHFYLALYWARALAEQTKDPVLRVTFTPIAQQLQREEAAIVGELIGVQGQPVEIGGYYHPDAAKTAAVMRPSATLNAIIDSLR